MFGTLLIRFQYVGLLLCVCVQCVSSYQPRMLSTKKYAISPKPDLGYFLNDLMKCYSSGGYPCKTTLGSHTPIICIAKYKVCDGQGHCPFGDDEIGHCGPMSKACTLNQIRCEDGKCASPCNGIVECPGSTDEFGCEQRDIFACGPNQVMCSNYVCATICNGAPECLFGEDEANCLPQCAEGEVICPETGRCAQFCGEPPLDIQCPPEQRCNVRYLVNGIVENYCSAIDQPPGCAVPDAFVADVTRLVVACTGQPNDLNVVATLFGLSSDLRKCEAKSDLASCICAQQRPDSIMFPDNFFQCRNFVNSDLLNGIIF